MEEQLLWEYRVQNFGNVWKSYKPEEMTAELNLWGEQGWEVVSAISHSQQHDNSHSKATVI